MNRIVFTGESTPIQKVLFAIREFPGIKSLALYTRLGESEEIEREAEKHSLELREIRDLKNPAGAEGLRALHPNWLFNVNSTVIFPKEVLLVPSKGALNMHPGRLPQYAGLHTHQWAIRNGEREFGATIHWMEPKIDAGPIAYAKNFPISLSDTGLTLFLKCVRAGTELTLEALRDIAAGRPPPRMEQDLSQRRIYYHRDALNGAINWRWSANRISDLVRAADYAPFQCPTYEPTTLLRERTIIVRKAEVANESGGSPGEIVRVGSEGIVVACGKLDRLLLKHVTFEGIGSFKSGQIAPGLDVQIGDRFV